jgi:hypothetical protein
MLKFDAEDFFYMVGFMDIVRASIKLNADDESITGKDREEFKGDFLKLGKALKALTLNFSETAARRFVEDLNKHDYTYGEMSRFLVELQHRIGDELSERVFMRLDIEKVKYFESSRDAFGKDTLSKFPSLSMEVEEAGKCYAADRNTASAFHLMRIMEFGLKIIAKELAVNTDTNRSWDAILKKVKDAIAEKHPRDEWTDFYNGVAARLYGVKDAWRNPTMHIEKNYGEEEALDIFNNVSSFMRHLSTKLSEPINPFEGA